MNLSDYVNLEELEQKVEGFVKQNPHASKKQIEDFMKAIREKVIAENKDKLQAEAKEQEEKIIKSQNLALPRIQRSTCHFCKCKDGLPIPEASGIFIEYQGKKMVLTAAHVVDKGNADEIYIYNENQNFLKLGGKWTYVGREKQDLACLEISSETLKKLKGNSK